jgi:DNA polymerase-1
MGGRPVKVYAPEPGSISAGDLVQALLHRSPDLHYGLDVESTALEDLAQWHPDFGLRLLQLAPNDDEAFVLTLSDPAQYEAALAILEAVETSYVSHTQMDVLSAAVVLGVDITMRNVDTRAIANEAHPEGRAGRDLKTLATLYGMPELEAADAVLHGRFVELYREAHPEVGRRQVEDKKLQRHGWSAIDIADPDYLLYAGLDAIAVRRLLPQLVAATGDGPDLLRDEVWLAGRANRIQLRGMLVDQDTLAAFEDEAQRETSEAAERVAELTDGIKIRSPKMRDWLARQGVDWGQWEELGGALTDKGAPSLAKKNVLLLREYDLTHAGAEAVEELVRFQAYADQLTKTSGVRSHLAPDGRVHPVLVPNGATTTSRMSSASPNFQNFSAKLRRIFVPDPGHVLLSVDFDQIELRVAAALAREPKMIEVIRAGGDLHQLTADLINRPRPVAKPTNFLIVYGGGAKALHELTGLPLDECARIIADWRAAYPSIDALAKYLGTERDAVYTISGRRLPVTFTKEGDARYWANINYVIQSSARDLLVDGWHTLEDQGHGPRIWYPIHDEFVLQAREDEAEAVLADASKAMTFDFRGVPVQASGIVLRQRDGRSTWMDGHEAEEIAAEMGWAA